ncbi:MAG: phosphoribosylglycinamide formyltransferase [Ferruginibacter sp.]|nr:phosphoribosylglycinamide formyltransferase [Chitinophagaceae bacterium]
MKKRNCFTPSSYSDYICPVGKIAVFASGAGSNTEKIIEHLASPSLPIATGTSSPKERDGQTPEIEVALIVCNNPGAGVLKIATEKKIPSLIIEKEKFFHGDGYVNELKEKEIDWIVLAGFLWKLPVALIHAFPGRIINIHPALLPKYGGKGMYGRFVHETVLNNKDTESGLTIHYVDEQYDNGDIIFQAKCPVLENDTPASLALRVHMLEHEWYPKIIERLIGE